MIDMGNETLATLVEALESSYGLTKKSAIIDAYIMAPTTDDFVFSFQSNGLETEIILDGTVLKFEETNGLWKSAPQSL